MTKVMTERFVPMRRSLLWLFDGDLYSALLLDVMLDKQNHFHEESELVGGYFYRSLSKLEGDLLGAVSKGAIRKRIEAWQSQPWFDTFVPDKPDEARRFCIDIVALGKALSCGGFTVPRWHVVEGVPEKHTPVSQEHTPVSERHKERTQPQEPSNNQTRTREDQPPDDPPIDQTQDFTAWLIDTFAKQGISLSPSKACALAQSICSHGMSESDERRYVLDKIKQAVVSEKPTGQALYYMGNKSDVEQWRGETAEDTDTEFGFSREW